MDKARLRQYARDLRKNSTNAEKHLWYNLRANRMGYKFKRQVPIGHYIVDFVCIEKRLIIELDGGQHQANQTYDAHRATELSKRGSEIPAQYNQVHANYACGLILIKHNDCRNKLPFLRRAHLHSFQSKLKLQTTKNNGQTIFSL